MKEYEVGIISIKTAALACSENIHREELRCVHIESFGNHQVVVGSNGRMMLICRDRILDGKASDGDGGVTIPMAVVEMICKLQEITPNLCQVRIRKTDTETAIELPGGVTITFPNVRYVNWRRVLPREFNNRRPEFEFAETTLLHQAFTLHGRGSFPNAKWRGSFPNAKYNSQGPSVFLMGNLTAVVMPLREELRCNQTVDVSQWLSKQ